MHIILANPNPYNLCNTYIGICEQIEQNCHIHIYDGRYNHPPKCQTFYQANLCKSSSYYSEAGPNCKELT